MPADAPLDLKSRSVLIVDDQKAMRHMLADLLRAFGVGQVHTARDGGEAIQQARTWMPHLVVTDWIMAPVDGLGLVRWLRRSAESPNRTTPILLLTGQNTQEHITAARDAGVSDVLIKPVSPRDLHAKVTATLERKRRFVEGVDYTGPCRRRRRNVDYQGPLRRLVDPTDAELYAVDRDDAAVARVSQRAEQLALAGGAVDLRDRGQVRAYYDVSLDARTDAQASRDRLLESATASLVAYVEAVGATGGLDRTVLETHVSAIQTLARLPRADEAARRQVACELGEMVAKKTATTFGLT